ncbi:MAG: PilZ domain-containing protein [Desulfobacterales bacterium]|jgi:hypothetical protein|nr:PilZ domain-containing protein [Desulfobacterales bacterium]
MAFSEKRKHKRVPIHNLVSYLCFDDNDKPHIELMGVALDISQGGVLLESVHCAEIGKTLLISTDDQNNIIEAKGKIAYCRKTSNGRLLLGVSFTGLRKEIICFVEGMIRAYYYQRRCGIML